ncbi:MAG: carbon monoxide dehydrogenase [Rhodospirillaceae bacterium]|nr:carbon monoxide dehydrogenase [Rhodospirillaceae bacterium]
MKINVNVNVNGQDVSEEVEPRTLLVDFIREKMKLTGTHVGCDTTQCGACTIHLDGVAIKSCTILAVQAHNRSITTIEGISKNDELHPMQISFKENHGLQCGFCTPGMVMAGIDIRRRKPTIEEDELRLELEGNICRCTGYHNIVKSILNAKM